MTPEERTMRARLGAHVSWAKTADPASRTAKARAAAAARFEKEAREMHPDATDEQIERAAAHLAAAHYSRMRLASAKKRREKAKKAA